VVAQLCHKLAIMRGGEIVEVADSKMLAEGRVQHPYSRQLLTASKGFDREAIAAFADF
jgi:peptide/nickel transport system ATP-binding protein